MIFRYLTEALGRATELARANSDYAERTRNDNWPDDMQPEPLSKSENVTMQDIASSDMAGYAYVTPRLARADVSDAEFAARMQFVKAGVKTIENHSVFKGARKQLQSLDTAHANTLRASGSPSHVHTIFTNHSDPRPYHLVITAKGLMGANMDAVTRRTGKLLPIESFYERMALLPSIFNHLGSGRNGLQRIVDAWGGFVSPPWPRSTGQRKGIADRYAELAGYRDVTMDPVGPVSRTQFNDYLTPSLVVDTFTKKERGA